MPVPKGTRVGGRQRGTQNKSSIDKALQREALRRLVCADLEAMTRAQIAHAKGIRHTFMRDENGRFMQLTDPKQIETALNSGEEGKFYWTFTKDPSVQAYTDLMNRALDKPVEPPQSVEHKGTIVIKHIQDDDDDDPDSV